MTPIQLIKLWMAIKPGARIKKWRNKRRAKKGKPPLNGESSMLEGKKTYLGILITVIGFGLGWLGIGGAAEAEELVNTGYNVVSGGIQLFGLIVATYGRWAAKQER